MTKGYTLIPPCWLCLVTGALCGKELHPQHPGNPMEEKDGSSSTKDPVPIPVEAGMLQAISPPRNLALSSEESWEPSCVTCTPVPTQHKHQHLPIIAPR